MALVPPAVLHAKVSVPGAASTTVIGAVAGQKIRVTSFLLDPAGATVIKIKSSGTSLLGDIPLPAMGMFGLAGDCFSPLFSTATGEELAIEVVSSVAVTGVISYFLE